MKLGWSLREFCDQKLLNTMTGRQQEGLKHWVTSNNTNTLGWVVPSHMWTFSSSWVTRENNPCILIYMSSKVARVDIKGYKGSSSYTKGAWKTLSSGWESSSVQLNVNAIFFPDTKPRFAAVCKFLQNVNWQAAAPFFLSHQPCFLGSCH